MYTAKIIVDKSPSSLDESRQYKRINDQVYGYSRTGEGNKRMRDYLYSRFGNDHVVNILMVMEQRFSYRGKQHYGFLKPCTALNTINKGKSEGFGGYQKSLLQECHMRDGRTFRRHFDSIGVRYKSSSAHYSARKDGVQFLMPDAEGNFSEQFYCYYHHRTDYRLVFFRNDDFSSWQFNCIRQNIGLPFDHELASKPCPRNILAPEGELSQGQL